MKAIWLMTVAFVASSAMLGLEYSDRPEEMMAHNRAHHLALRAEELYGMPAAKQARLIWDYRDDWEHAAVTECRDWTITINHANLIHSTDVILNNVLPHEYGHLVHCYLHGGVVGVNPHGRQWKQYATALGMQ